MKPNFAPDANNPFNVKWAILPIAIATKLSLHRKNATLLNNAIAIAYATTACCNSKTNTSCLKKNFIYLNRL